MIVNLFDSTAEKWRFSLLSKPDDLEKVGQLFTQSFNQPFSTPLWQWKYPNNRQYSLGIFKGEELVGHYGGLVRDIMFQGECLKMIQSTDVMVHPKERSSHGRKGVFFQLSGTFLKHFVGHDKEFAQAFGFPSERHTRLAVLLGLYDRVGKVLEAKWEPLPKLSSFFYKSNLFDVDRHDLAGITAKLWPAMSRSLPENFVGLRTVAYLNFRFLQHPLIKYQMYLVVNRFTKRPAGLFVLRRHDNNVFELMDIVADVQDMPLLIDFARNETFRQNGSHLFSWMSEAAILKLASNAKVTDIEVTIPCVPWTDSPGVAQLQGKWWLMSGDTDWR